MYTYTMEKPEKQSFSVRVETEALNRSVSKNTSYFHLLYRLPMPFKSSCILPHIVAHPGGLKAVRTRICGSFSLTDDFRNGF
jgi:hypothetical protein